ncbi:uncharacterized protein LOC115754265 isoform X2 [Rhodamnia argentea]|uniref:Uncharacterized protein LOC115754265 isoform X2 n=1 Tax=Rhodamnia argentea TaxID=178133 RepID=A0A8B8QPY8_9MYRT|nr:uncharacterized protein LOC115754265 isoform X2 [Rhodamnia argentea]
MLCSVPTDRSGSNWLDRLRSTKGFPAGDGLDLDHFLANPQNPTPPTPPASDPSTSESIHSVQSQITTQNGAHSVRAQNPGDEKDWYGIMTGVLSELFIMGDGEGQIARKSSRKQPNPRFFPNSRNCDASAGEKISDCAAAAARGENAGWRTPSADLESDAVDRTARGADVDGEEEEEEEKESGDNKDLVGYSRSEVTVIDTSCELWKFEKVLYRRKNVWKVRDRKGKVRSSIGRKKRKLGGGSEDGNVGGKKKLKVSGFEVDESNENIENGKADTSKELADDLDKSSKTRFHLQFCESPRKRRTGGSSVVLIKGIPTAKSKLVEGKKLMSKTYSRAFLTSRPL